MLLIVYSLKVYTILQSLEGHVSSVLKCEFFNYGTQVASCGGDGFIKIWCLKTSECVTSLDKHSSKVWALSSKTKYSF